MDIIQKTRDDYNKIANFYAMTRNHAGELVKFKSIIKDGQHIMDWGCGNGRLLYLLENFKINYFGIDQSLQQLKIAKKNFAKMTEDGRAKFFCNAHKEKIFPENYFDLIFVVASLHHLPDRKTRLKLLKRLHQEMREDGQIIITVWNLESNWAKQKLKKDWKKIGNDDFFIPWKDQNGQIITERYYHHFKKDELKELLEKSGFTNIKLYYNTGLEETNKKEGRNLVAIAQK